MEEKVHISGCLSVGITPSGGISVKLIPRGGISVLLAPVCAVDLGPVLPPNVLLTVDNIPFVTADGYYLIVATA